MDRYKPIRKFTVGGMTFIQIGQLSISYCITRKREPLITRQMLSSMIALDGWMLTEIAKLAF